MSSLKPGSYKWLYSGDQIFPALLAAIDSAQKKPSGSRPTLTPMTNSAASSVKPSSRACQRGVSVRLAHRFLRLVLTHGRLLGTLRRRRWRNPLVQPHPPQALSAFATTARCSWATRRSPSSAASTSPTFTRGDGVTRGWYGPRPQTHQPPSPSNSPPRFDEMFARARFQAQAFHPPASLLGQTPMSPPPIANSSSPAPARGRNPFSRALRKDLNWAQDRSRSSPPIFFPPWRSSPRPSCASPRAGGPRAPHLSRQVGCLHFATRLPQPLPAASSAPASRFTNTNPKSSTPSSSSWMTSFYAGSSNLDPRSLQINYELMLRFQGQPHPRQRSPRNHHAQSQALRNRSNSNPGANPAPGGTASSNAGPTSSSSASTPSSPAGNTANSPTDSSRFDRIVI